LFAGFHSFRIMSEIPQNGFDLEHCVINDEHLSSIYISLQDACATIIDDKKFCDDLAVPTMVVTGTQSAGKTTYIESMVGFQVGPTDRKTATRCPVRYVLRRGDVLTLWTMSKFWPTSR